MSDQAMNHLPPAPSNVDQGDHSYLVALYQAERSDLTALYLASVAVLAFGTTIAAAALGLIVTADHLSPMIPLVMPIATSTVVLYNSVVSSLAKVRCLSALEIEKEIFSQYRSPLESRRDKILVSAGDRVLDVRARPLFGIANLVCNAAVILSGVGFAIFCILRAEALNAQTLWIIVSAVVNGAMLLHAATIYVKGQVFSGLELK